MSYSLNSEKRLLVSTAFASIVALLDAIFCRLALMSALLASMFCWFAAIFC